jgi:RNA polymerase sigma-70 factor (ECF subfamily)
MDPGPSSQIQGMVRDPPGHETGTKGPEPFAELYRRSFARVWGVLGRLGVHQVEDREDLTQDVYLVAHEKLSTRDPGAPEVAWLLTIARKVVSNNRTRLRTQMETPMDDPDTALDLPSDAPSPDDLVGRRRVYAALVGGLSDERREVFEMHEVEGFTTTEIAAALDVPEGTVSSRLRLAREEVLAATARLAARDKRNAAAVVFPFGAGAWHPVRSLFDDVPAGVEDGVWRSIRRVLAHGAVLGAAGATGAAGALAASKTAGVVAIGKATLGAVLAGAFALGGVTVGAALQALQVTAAKVPAVVVMPEVPTSAAVAAGTTAPVPERAAEPVTSATVASAVGAVPRVGPGVGPAATATAAASQLDPEELALIARAQVAFARKDRAGTLDALEAHARKFPKGKLTPEREGIRAKLVEMGGAWGAESTDKPVARDGGGSRMFGSDE